jgi:hypothetical protein
VTLELWLATIVSSLATLALMEAVSIFQWLSHKLVRRAAHWWHDDEGRAEIRAKEWKSLISIVPSETLKLILAVNFVMGGVSRGYVRWSLIERAPESAGRRFLGIGARGATTGAICLFSPFLVVGATLIHLVVGGIVALAVGLASIRLAVTYGEMTEPVSQGAGGLIEHDASPGSSSEVRPS